jgi:NAD(P)H-hydrate epimerase
MVSISKPSRIPTVTADEMREVDRLAVERYGMQILQMMENAGRCLAELVRRHLGGSVLGKHLIVAVSKGNNGGGGMVAARHLSNWGANVTVLLESETLSGAPALQWEILKRLPIQRVLAQAAVASLSAAQVDLVVDALIGYGLSGSPRGWVAQVIRAINALNLPVIALDIPSGLDVTSGRVYDPCIRATATLTLALPKTGLVKPEARSAVGALYLADIGIPDVLYKAMRIEIRIPIFAHSTLIKLTPHL